MKLYSRFPIIFWFIAIALLTSISVSYYSYRNVYKNQVEEVKNSELKRINQRLSQLQGTVNDFNRRKNYSAIHRELFRLSSDPTMDLIIIVDEHGMIKYSSLIELRNTPITDFPTINKTLHRLDENRSTSSITINNNEKEINGIYPLEKFIKTSKSTAFTQSHLFARFDLLQTIAALRYRQEQEALQIILVHFSILFAGFLLLFNSMRKRISSIINGIKLFSEGNYDSRIQLSGYDEFSKISKGFDSMAAKLQAQNQDLINLTEILTLQNTKLSHQEQDLRVTLNSIGDAVITTDSNGLITRMNPVAQTLTDWSLEAALGQPINLIFNIIDPRTQKIIENPVNQVLNTGETVYLSGNTTLISRRGLEYHISDSAAPIRNENNKIQGMVLIFNDVSEQYRLRQEAANSEHLLRSIMDNSPAVIYVKNVDGEFTFVNQRFLTVFKMERENVLGKKLHDLFPKENADEMIKSDLIILAYGETLEIEETAPHEDGLHTYTSIKFPLLDLTGEIYAVCGISTDISDKIQQEQLLRRSQKMDALGKLTGGIAHDYNNMLGVILGYSELLDDALKQQPNLQKFAREIIRASERGANLTKKLLTFSRPQQSENKSLNINELLQDRFDMLQKVLTARIKLEFDLDEDLWPVSINSGDFEDSIVNITINAMHAMSEGGQLTIKTLNEELSELDAGYLHITAGEYVYVSFTDTGIGMNSETQEKMFDPFFTSKGNLGAGLGLSQVYGLIQTNGGAIKVNSEHGHGTRLTIYLPRYQHTKPDMFIEKIDEKINLSGTETILVVDDEAGLRSLAEQILTTNGYNVFIAENGHQALSILQSEKVDILFSDIIMPEMDGFELAREVQKQYPQVKIQLASGYNDSRGNVFNDDSLQANILHKPFSTRDLLQCIKKLALS